MYKGYNTSMITDDFRSTSERLFEKYCEKNENVEYVYKNGDSGQQYLSIVYGTNFDKQRLFYPDYIVQLKDETIWLSQKLMSELFDVEVNTINYHLKEIYKSGEIQEQATY